MIFSIIYKVIRKIFYKLIFLVEMFLTYIILKGNSVKYQKGFVSKGVPIIDVWRNGILEFGENIRINNGSRYNRIGRQQRCIFVVASGAHLKVGANTGISGSAIICYREISIGSNVKIGGNVVMYDTDFHSLNPLHRRDKAMDKKYVVTAPIVIGDDVFIGAHSTILKGVCIGNNAIVGACSVVTKNIPENEIWGGNPAKFIRKIDGAI